MQGMLRACRLQALFQIAAHMVSSRRCSSSGMRGSLSRRRGSPGLRRWWRSCGHGWGRTRATPPNRRRPTAIQSRRRTSPRSAVCAAVRTASPVASRALPIIIWSGTRFPTRRRFIRSRAVRIAAGTCRGSRSLSRNRVRCWTCRRCPGCGAWSTGSRSGGAHAARSCALRAFPPRRGRPCHTARVSGAWDLPGLPPAPAV